MATPTEGGKLTPFQPNVVERIAGAVRYAVTGQAPPWFGPNEPMQPQAPPEVEGRRYDFPVGVNLQYQPRKESGESGIDFETLRRLADPPQGGLDLLRLAIETRKDQMEAQRWHIRGRDGKDGGERAKNLMLALRKPDLVHTFRQWQRQLLEDLLVIDAPAIYLRPVPDGFRLPEVMDGATLKRLIDGNGRVPLPPDPAFQQILKGLPAVDYTLDEVIYAPRNLRSYRLYGQGPVEQVVNIINLGLKRQLHVTAYYTAGNVPEHLVGVPESWNPDQLKMAQDWMDSKMQGNLEDRRKLMLIPGGMHALPLKDPKLQDALDEWLARVICWAFNLPPSALVKEVNRATAETAQETGQQEGLEPLKEWWADVMNEVILRCWGVDDLEFAYQDEEISDPAAKATFWKAFSDMKAVTADEIREKALKMDPLTPEQKEELNPPPPPGLGGDMGGPDVPGHPGPGKPQGAGGPDSAPESLPPASKLEKKKRGLTPINRGRAAATRCARAIRRAVKAYLTAQRDALVAAVRDAAGKVQKGMDLEGFQDLWDSLDQDARKKLLETLRAELEDMALDGAEQALAQLGHIISQSESGEDLQAMLHQANDRAVAWADQRAADLVGMRNVGTRDEPEWVTNPNPAWCIDDTTRQGIQDLVEQAVAEGWTNDELAAAIGDSALFDEARAEMVARTETAFADVQGNLEGYKASGVCQGKQWLAAQDEMCDECQALDGIVVGLDENFPGDGGDAPPLHPNCRCDLAPVLMATEQE